MRFVIYALKGLGVIAGPGGMLVALGLIGYGLFTAFGDLSSGLQSVVLGIAVAIFSAVAARTLFVLIVFLSNKYGLL